MNPKDSRYMLRKYHYVVIPLRGGDPLSQHCGSWLMDPRLREDDNLGGI